MSAATPVLGIALSGGGAEGLAQLGVLKVLDRGGIPVGYVTGTSMGAVIGAVYATSRSAEEAEQRILNHLRSTGIGFNADTVARLEVPRVRARSRRRAGGGAWRDQARR